MTEYHRTVLLQEAVAALMIRTGGVYVDATFGGGGHTRLILESNPTVRVIAFDADPDAIAQSMPLQKEFGERLIVVHRNFQYLDDEIRRLNMPRIDGVLFDLGVSSHQLDDADRGFSLLRGGPLDMRMDPRLSVTAADLINGLGKKELIRLFETLGEEPYAKKIASRIVEQRQKEPFTRTTQLSSLIAHVVGRRNEGIHPATRVFQAIRMAVNSEREALAHGLSCAVSLLGPGGRIVVISFHSIEDRIVKQQFQNAEHEGKARIVGKLITPNDDEVLENRRSRSAKMRILEKL